MCIQISFQNSHFSAPAVDLLNNFIFESSLPELSTTDTAYAIVLISVVGLSVLLLSVLRFVSGDPIFSKPLFKLVGFRYQNYDSLPTHIENGNGVDHRDAKVFAPEPLNGWRLRMGILQSLVLLALLIVHAVIFATSRANMLGIVLIVFWVYLPIRGTLTSGCHICLQCTAFSSVDVSSIIIQYCVWAWGRAFDLSPSYGHCSSTFYKIFSFG